MYTLDSTKLHPILCERGMSVRDLASASHLRSSTVYMNLSPPSGKKPQPHFKTIWKIAKALGVRVEDICTRRIELVPVKEGKTNGTKLS